MMSRWITALAVFLAVIAGAFLTGRVSGMRATQRALRSRAGTATPAETRQQRAVAPVATGTQRPRRQGRRNLTFGLSAFAVAFAVTLGGYVALAYVTNIPVTASYQIDTRDVSRGKQLINAYGCGACHTIPGIRMARGRVGPPLDELNRTAYLAGVIAYTPENLAQWIRFPQDISPETDMPNLGVTDEEAQQIAAYLLSIQ